MVFAFYKNTPHHFASHLNSMNTLWKRILSLGQSPNLTVDENRRIAVVNRIAFPFSLVLLANTLIFSIDGNWLGVGAAIFVLVAVCAPVILNYFDRFYFSFRLFIPIYYVVLIAIAFLVGEPSNIEFGFILILMAISIFSKKVSHEFWLRLFAFVGFFLAVLIYKYTTPILIYPYPFWGGLMNGLTIGFIAFQIIMYFKEETQASEQAILSSREKYKSLIAGAMDAVIIINDNGKIIQWNERAVYIFGYSAKEAINRTWHNLVIPRKYRHIYREGLKRALKTGESAIFYNRKEVVGINKQGKEFPMEMSVVPLKHEGKYIFTAFLRDITDKKIAEKQLVDMNQELRQFASVASHDMKEPLRTISSFSDLLERRIPENKETQEFLHFIKDASKRMTRLLEDLISYARAGQETDQLEDINLNNIIILVKNNLHNLIQANQATIEFDHLPIIRGHQTPFIQLFQNLISNGIKYHKDNVAPKITIDCQLLHNGWEISISDNGIGMGEEYLHRIFEPFTRLHTREKFEGSGIGLAVCKKITDRYQGKIWAKSTLGVGTTFYLQLPKKTIPHDLIIPAGMLKEN